MIDLSKLKNGDKVDLVTHNGTNHKGWFVHDARCGYFTKEKDGQLAGFLFSESIAVVNVVK